MKIFAAIFLFLLGCGIALVFLMHRDIRGTDLAHLSNYLTHRDYAKAARALRCEDLKLFIFTNQLGYLEKNIQLLQECDLSTNGVYHELVVAHGRLFRFYQESNPDEATRHFLSASNYYYLLRPRALSLSDLLTNSIFNVEPH